MANILEQITGGVSLTLDLGGFVLCLMASIVAALIVEFLYALFYDNRATGSQIHRAFLLLGPAITFLFISVQLSLPLSLGLLGALSIVRFRTPIKEPEEIGFLMLLIAGSIGIATFNFIFVGILYAAVFIVLSIRRWSPIRHHLHGGREGLLLVNMPDEVYEERGARLAAQLGAHFKGLRLEGLSSVEGATSIEYAFSSTAGTPWERFQKELREEIPYTKLNVLFARPGPVE